MRKEHYPDVGLKIDVTPAALSFVKNVVRGYAGKFAVSQPNFETGGYLFDTANITDRHACSNTTQAEESDTIDKFSCLSMLQFPVQMKGIETFRQIKGRMTWCRLHFCAQHYQDATIKNGVMSSKTERTIPFTMTENPSGDNIGIAGDDELTKFHLGNKSRNALSNMIQDLTQSPPLVSSFITPFLQKSDSVVPFFNSIATVSTALIRCSQANPQVKNRSGEAFGPEVYVRVRWEWFLMPLSIVLLSGIFLVLTVVQSWNRHTRFRSSIVAALFHGLEGWDDDELRIERDSGGEKETDSMLLKKAERMKVVLKENDKGTLKFVKVE
ncbi:MAG: hypothetical protein Q9160_007270 [Pyrenula sp. 1 TL-2023]